MPTTSSNIRAAQANVGKADRGPRLNLEKLRGDIRQYIGEVAFQNDVQPKDVTCPPELDWRPPLPPVTSLRISCSHLGYASTEACLTSEFALVQASMPDRRITS